MSNDESVVVHKFEAWDQNIGDMVVQPSKRTAEDIKQIKGGKLIVGTAEKVKKSLLDRYDRYYPPEHCT